MEKPPKDELSSQNGGFLNLNRVAGDRPKHSWRTWLIGRPLPTADAPHQTVSKAVGLAVFGADALSSIAYAPQETLVILAAAGTQAFGYAFPISVVITVLLAIVTVSYLQTIRAYPTGGGAYTVVKENLGEQAALIAGAALLTDYILLAAVTVASGVAQIVSAFPDLFPFRVWLSIGLLGLIAIANLRGVKESGSTFALPTYFFLIMTMLTVMVGFIRYLSGTLGIVTNPPPLETLHTEPITLFLLLRAFSNGTTALTGVEVIANGVKSFREPRTHNAMVTMVWMSTILAVLFLSIVYLLGVIGAVPAESETVISAAGPYGLWRSRAALSGNHNGNNYYSYPGDKYSLCRLPSLERHYRRRWIFASSVDLSRQPAGLLTRDHYPHDHCLLAHHRFQRQCDCPHSTLGGGCLSLVYSFTGGHGTALVE